MIIKKHISGNEYIIAEDVWVRNFTKSNVSPVQITHMFDQSDYGVILKNEELNKNYPNIANEKLRFKGVVIVSDGYDFEKRHLFLRDLPKNIAILAVNRSLAKWKLMDKQRKKAINAYVVNNPYKECLSYLPSRESQYYPACIASTRTNYQFLNKYYGDIYTYAPTPEMKFGTTKSESYFIDDYRNTICAAICFAYQLNVEKILLLCCDDSFVDKRDYSVELPNGLFTYPQHVKSQKIIDANLYWITHQERKNVEVANYSSGIDCINAAYINSEQEALDFFKDQQQEGIGDVK